MPEAKSRNVMALLQRKLDSFVSDLTPAQSRDLPPRVEVTFRAKEAAKPSIEIEVPTVDPLEAARVRGQRRLDELWRRDDMLSSDDFAERLGTTRETVNTRRKENRVIGLNGARRGFRYPAWQIGPDGKPYVELRELVARLGGNHWAAYDFLMATHSELDGRKGIDALAAGKGGVVIELAESHARGDFV
jgi:DNA-binding transcriptional regulator YiaG